MYRGRRIRGLLAMRLLLRRADRSPHQRVFLLNAARRVRLSRRLNCWAIDRGRVPRQHMGSCSCVRVKISLRSAVVKKSAPPCAEHVSSPQTVRVVWVRFSRRFR